MVGITSFGAYIPFLRLDRGALRKGAKGEKALANFDEDSITMAVAAVLECLGSMERESVDGLYFATTTSPYREKQAATVIAVAADLRQNLITADFGNSLRAGANALRSAADAVGAGTAGQMMVAAADTRLGAPGSPQEMNFGDGAAAILIGKDDVVADLKGSYSVCQEIMDVWRIEGSRFVRSWEDRFIGIEGYQKVMKDAVSGVLKETGLKPADFAKVVFYTPDQKSSMQLAGRLGFDPKTQLQDNLFGFMGNTGTPYTLMMLVGALEDSNPGDKILLVNYGNGADAFVFEVTEKIKDRSTGRGIKDFMDSKQVINEYQAYVYSKGLIQGMGPVYPVPYGSTSAPAVLREVDKNLRFHGVKCENCGTVQYPPQRTCVKCHSKDQFQRVRLSDKKANLFTFSLDSVSSMINSPAVISVVDFEGGGRTECFMTDALVQKVKVGMEVEMTFRKLSEREDIINYAWKAMPARL